MASYNYLTAWDFFWGAIYSHFFRYKKLEPHRHVLAIYASLKRSVGIKNASIINLAWYLNILMERIFLCRCAFLYFDMKRRSFPWKIEISQLLLPLLFTSCITLQAIHNFIYLYKDLNGKSADLKFFLFLIKTQHRPHHDERTISSQRDNNNIRIVNNEIFLSTFIRRHFDCLSRVNSAIQDWLMAC
jgi:hypothetical protein